MSAKKNRPRLAKVEVVANVASGSVEPDAPAELETIFAEFGLKPNIRAPQVGELRDGIKASLDSGPDLLVVLAGDGTIRCAAELAGPKGPPIAPLPGGTMNMLPFAVYGRRPWQEVLRDVLENGEERDLGGGCIEGHRFLCGAILGSPARLGAAREAAREGRIVEAFHRTRDAMQRAFTGRLRYSLDKGGREKAQALVLMCPIASKVMDDDAPAFEAAALNPTGAAEVLRMGFNAIVSDWREDPAVDNRPCRRARVWSARKVPALLDGESVSLPTHVEVTYDPRICRVLATPKDSA
ncbi:diacylglycerol kinase family protein [Phenylobacterium sp.]|uniref:diacylglycerol/lipid kinase family protein n=1 Tax=Phenylobacterium sp. TaxID=1871053 RepID=UPI0025F34647|nr:diacylglycerol kinase family protein [Phenylobacterium sp.]MBX3483635.1 NAD(+)/NADH kinase [Phenylobacterium sp.]